MCYLSNDCTYKCELPRAYRRVFCSTATEGFTPQMNKTERTTF